MKKSLVFLIALLLIPLLIGCSTGEGADTANDQAGQAQEETGESQQAEDAAGTADIIEPEQIVTLQEAADIMGIELVMGERTDNEVVGQKICAYEAADPEDFSMFQVAVNQLAFLPPEQVQMGNNPEHMYQATKDNFIETLEPVSGIGDDAFIDTLGLHMLYRGYYVVISSGNSDDPAKIEGLKKAGQKAVANLDALLD